MRLSRSLSPPHLPPFFFFFFFFFFVVVVIAVLFRFSTFNLKGPRPSSSFTLHRPDAASNPSTTPRCPFSSGLALSPCSSTRVPMGMGEGGRNRRLVIVVVVVMPLRPLPAAVGVASAAPV